MRWYLDASVVLHLILPGDDRRAAAWFATVVSSGGQPYSSVLLRLEVIRVLRREGLDPGRAQPTLERISLVSIDDGVLRFAAAIQPHVKSLDAINLATCALLGSRITLATHDQTMSQVARELGLDTTDPLLSRDAG